MSEATRNKFTMMSFIMAILIIYVHAGNLVSYDVDEAVYSNLELIQNTVSSYARSIAIPVFFMLSGYKFFRFDISDSNWMDVIKRKLKSRAKTVLLPYVLWCVLMYLFYIIITRIEPIANIMNSDEKVAISLNEFFNAIVNYKYIFTFWYMRDLIIILALTPLIAAVLRKKSLSIISFTVILATCIFGIDYYIIYNTSLLYFFMGSILGVYFQGLFERDNSGKEKACSLVLFVPCLIAGGNSIFILSNLCDLLCPIFVWIFLDGLCRKIKPRWFCRQSFFIYAFHIIPLSVVIKILARIGNSSSLWITFSFFAAPIIALVIIWAASKITNLFIPKFYSLLCGNRG